MEAYNRKRSFTPSVYSAGTTSSIISKTFSFKSRYTSDVPFKGPFGLTNLYSPPSGDAAVTAHIICVHGLGGGSESTWTHNMTFWPRDLLPQVEAFRNTATYSFGYNSDFPRSSILDINDFSRSLLARMLSEPLILNSRCPILLVGHDVGGLVVKRAYAVSVQYHGYEDLSSRIRGIFFIATPQRGSDLAPILGNIFRLSSDSKPFLRDLTGNSEALQNINIEFGMYSRDLLLYSFYETKKLSMSALKDVLIVPREHAILNYHNEQAQLLYGDHKSICKFSSLSDPNFKALWHTIAACIKTLQLASSGPASEHVVPQLKQQASASSLELSSYLGIREPPVEELQRITYDRLAGTCEWLLRSEAFEEWQDSQTTRIFWLRGPPGSGKSFAAGFAIDHFRNKGVTLCYYFFIHDDEAKSRFETFLLSMAYQMAILFPAIFEKISEICRRDQDIGKAESRVLLRKLWEQGILNILPATSIIWVIDATNECQQEDELARFLRRAQEKGKGSIKIFATTRNPAIRYFSPLDHIIPAEVKTADVQADIAAYLNTHIGRIMGPEAERDLLKERILQKSNGCFLWAILVLRRLARIPGSRARLYAIDELLPDMYDLYSRIVQSISEGDAELSKFILTWVITSARAMTVDELRFVLENYFYSDETIGAVEELISNNCHDLVHIDNKKLVRMRHDSARSFFVDASRDLDFKYDHPMTIRMEEAHKMLAMSCLNFLNGAAMKAAGGRRLRRRTSERLVFVSYASSAVLEHVNNVAAGDNDIITELATFLQHNVLTLIEHLARARDLETILKMAQVLKMFVVRHFEVQIIPRYDTVVINGWATDLFKLVSRFSRELLTCPESILSLIPAFCPTDSAPYQRYGTLLTMAASIHGLPNTYWDDLLCTVELNTDGNDGINSQTGSQKERLLCIGTSVQHFCIGTSIGRIAISNGQTCIQECLLEHGTGLPIHEAGVLQVQFAVSEPLLASVSKRFLRIWDTLTWQQQWKLQIPGSCLALCFVNDDSTLFLALSNNEMWELDLIDCQVVKQVKWTDRLDGNMLAFFRGTCPSHASFNTDRDLLAVAYRNNDVLVWNYEHDSYQIYNPDAGGRCEPTTRSNLSVDTMVFSNLPVTSLLAVNYTTADLAVFDTVDGSMRGRKSKIYATKILSSPDGRTLAAARRNGVIELYDFETMNLLHRIATVDDALSALAFSADSTRLLEIRAGGRTCRVWDPPALFRRDVGYDSAPTTSDVNGFNSGKADGEEAKAVVGIGAIECDYAGEHFFVGKDDGTVSVYDVGTGEPICVLFSHKANVKLLQFDFKNNTLISVDTASILMIHGLERPAHNGVDWTATPILTHRPLQFNIRQVLQQTDMGRLLVCTDSESSLFSLSPTTGEDKLLDAVDNSNDVDDGTDLLRCCWAQHPEKPSLLLFLTPEKLHLYSWDSLQRVSPPQGISIFGDGLPSDVRLTDARALSTGRLLGLIALPINHSARRTTQFICLPSSELSEEPAAGLANATLSTPLVIECLYVVGKWHERLVFVHSDGWICSVRTMTLLGGLSGNSVVDGVQHHFPPPAEWLRTNRGLLIRVTRRGDLLFVVHGRVAVVRRGLDKSFDVGSPSLDGI